MQFQSFIPIKKEWDIVAARQQGRDMSKQIGFGSVDQARIATAISELARNIYLYAEQGKICFEILDDMEHKGIKIIAKDDGPGIPDVGKVMEDGYTTSGGLGAGLPGIKRLMDYFDIVSEEGKGTEVTVQKWLR
ncbi:anti-sigma regulatory factor [Salinibacillus xinjiangensis]|uniref:ATP-binding protein n=1 Tax=Salinibacillus xinjiangensis TaxID=1229268 RepID=A0A6G1X8I6_9BACI|nr:anti-sigma regulatory factor [Salinibacillus xinjiangensis]MRG87215.1 ATP-binding protein [Salinibacillus xinjiangensis]